LLNYASAAGAPRAGIIINGNTVVDLRDALPDKSWSVSTLAAVKLLPPILFPPAIYCTGANYMAHADEVPDITKCRLQLWVNQEKMQETLVDKLIFNIAELIEYLSRRMTLLPGDVIATGTPSGVGRPRGIFLKPGDQARVALDCVGTLENPVVQGI
jgi:2-keto-4-pentenoate hydratase/2-oxohepta-3-ene-1,7-dioic acid hydratase in catechol pathway